MLLPALLGLLLGFLGSILVGPIALLVFSRGLKGQYRSGLQIAAGAALAEGIYAFLAYWGVSEVLARFPTVDLLARAASALVLVGMGVTFLIKSDGEARSSQDDEAPGGFAMGFTVTGLNPAFLATWGAAIAVAHSLGILSPSHRGAAPFGLGVAGGVVGFYWAALALLERHRNRFADQTLARAVQGVGGLLVAAGVWFGLRLVLR